MTISPVLFLIFNRPDTTALVMEAIRAAAPPRLYVAADGPRDRPGEAERCEEARRIATAVDWPCEVRTLFRDRNLGPRDAPSGAITWFFEHEAEGMILEDDCLPSADFFPFCTELLERFRADKRVMAICGSCYAAPDPSQRESYYFSYYADMWGWATWRRSWRLYDREMSHWPAFKAARGLKALAAGRQWHEAYWTNLFDATSQGKIICWDHQWMYTVIEQGGLACYPARNLVSNLGFRSDATHTVIDSQTHVTSLAANMPHEKLAFPLVHPTVCARSTSLERRIEEVRLDLKPPANGLRSAIKSVARRLLSEQLLGHLDYYRHPERRAGWGGPFNGQKARKALFLTLMRRFSPAALVETGTYLGATTEVLAETGLPVYTVEGSARAYGFAKVRLRKRRNVTLLRDDSRAALRQLFDGQLRSLAGRTVFFYLDAHWNADLPLAEELDIVFSRCPAAVVMVDDFQVPNDAAYAYDDYGPGKALTPDYIGPAVAAFGLVAFYPATPAAEESGARRGCVVLARGADHGATLASLSLLRTAADMPARQTL